MTTVNLRNRDIPAAFSTSCLIFHLWSVRAALSIPLYNFAESFPEFHASMKSKKILLDSSAERLEKYSSFSHVENSLFFSK